MIWQQEHNIIKVHSTFLHCTAKLSFSVSDNKKNLTKRGLEREREKKKEGNRKRPWQLTKNTNEERKNKNLGQ